MISAGAGQNPFKRAPYRARKARPGHSPHLLQPPSPKILRRHFKLLLERATKVRRIRKPPFIRNRRNRLTDAETGQIKQFRHIRMKDLQNNEILDEKGKVILTREYEYTRNDGSKVVIQEHSAGHTFGAPGGIGDQGGHFNLRPISNTRTGKLPGADDHYYFEVKK